MGDLGITFKNSNCLLLIMSNNDLRIYKNLSTILIIQLVLMLISEIFNRIIFPYLYNSSVGLSIYTVIASFLGFTSFIVIILWVVHLFKLYRVSGDSSVGSASKIFLGVIIAQVITFLINLLGIFLYSISQVIYFLVVHYLPYLVINFIYIIAWVKLSNHFKTTLVSKNGKNGCILIILSIIPSIITQLVYILFTLQFGPIINWGASIEFAIIILVLTGVSYIGIILEIVGYILVIGVFNKADTPRSPMTPITPISPDGIVQNNITHEEPTLNKPRYCINCGAPTIPGADFCNNCGNKM